MVEAELKKVVLILRPEPGASRFAAEAEALGFEALRDPILRYVPFAFTPPALEGFDALVFTSAQAVRVFSAAVQGREIAVYCVGGDTARFAKELGFENVYSADGGGAELSALVRARGLRRVLYPRAKDISFQMLTALVQHNIQCVEVIVYEAVAAETLSVEAEAKIRSGEVSYVVFFSKRTVEVFMKLTERAGLRDRIESIKPLCISPKVLNCVQTYGWGNASVAAQPDGAGMSALLEDLKTGEKKMSAPNSKTAIDNAAEVIERFGGIRPMAKKIDVAVTTIQGWKKRDTIPAGRRGQILDAAKEFNVDLSDIITGAPRLEGAANENGAIVLQNEENPSKIKTEARKPEIENPSDFVAQKAAHVAADENMSVPRAAMPRAEALSEPLNKKIAEAEHKAVAKSAWISVILMLVAVGAVAALLWPQKEATQRIGALEQNIGEIQGDVDAVKEQQSFFGALIPDDLDEQLSSLQEKAGATQEQLGQALDKAKVISEDVLGEGAGSLEQRVEKFQGHMNEVISAPQVAALLERFDVMQADETGQTQIDQTMSELGALLGNISDTANASIDETLNQARARSTAMGETFEGVPSEDLKAAALLLGMSQFRSSLNRDNAAFENDLQVLKGLIGEENVELNAALDRLAPSAESGVLTPSGLTNEFKSMAGEAVIASLKGEDVSLGEKAQAKMNELLQVEKNGELVTGTETQASLQAAENMLADGDIEGAMAQVEALDGEAADVMNPWLEEARVTVMANKVKAMIDAFMRGEIPQVGDMIPEGMVAPDDVVLPQSHGSQILQDPTSGTTVLKP